ncbi:putative gamma-glutamylcyclotransferase [Pseudolycoriella hygida]|uniref:Gamma-glutamylcyclotransferase family protein n=1 Tax=Pseudolycoriella hygida TaxID=35572 RepID=A0A9Q0N423_9DIPT|nr:putative gamma-glutamylcyclotransferase [Pseudolycoriella hygida]
MSSSLSKVFVYGTLKKNQPNHYWLTNKNNGAASFLSNGTTKIRYPLVISTRYNIPFLLNKPGIGRNIKGEIYEINDEMLTKLDILEDYPELYDRQIEPIETDSGLVHCWVYLLRNFPTKMLDKSHLEEYTETSELPYLESYDSSSEPHDAFDISKDRL